MGKLNRRRLAVAAGGATAGAVTALIGVFMLSTPAGFILTGLVVVAASAGLIRIEEPEK